MSPWEQAVEKIELLKKQEITVQQIRLMVEETKRLAKENAELRLSKKLKRIDRKYGL